ncbi:MAG: xanthine dehydrogenase family protein molybdopterin-binding subunit [Alphaproteobacteria bacterium]|nr:xanthine dehydrogenase family protein molybdopterin-binding subunit [Alphaproteobacteria bacterium]
MSSHEVALPASLTVNPRLDRWLKFQPDETVRIATGKVEIGQGIVTALSQIAAEELDLPLDRVVMLAGDTDEGPDERYTSSSLSIMVSGASIRLVCAEARALLVARAALRLNCSPDDISVTAGRFAVNGALSELSYWSVAPEIDWSQAPTGGVAPKPASEYRIVGQDIPRQDLPAKLCGGAYIHDRLPDDILHARVLRQPGRGAALQSLDEAAVRRAAGVEIEIFKLANFVAFIGPDEPAVETAAAVAAEHAQWDGAPNIEPAQQEAAWLQGQPAIDNQYGAAVDREPSGRLVEATFSRPYIAHASMAPSCALALYVDDHLTIWSHGQGMHPLRRNIAEVLNLPLEAITARHLDGAGCYGHNGADDAALDAAIIAVNKPGHCIRLQWRRQDEFGFEPFGPAMLVTMRVRLDDAGQPQDWTSEIWSPTHVQRPGTGSGYLLAAEALPNPPPALVPQDPIEEAGGGGTRNARPYYDIPNSRILHHLVTTPPVRTSALRTLGAAANVFAMEAMMDDLAAMAGKDPLDYRLGLLSDPRARAVLSEVAARAGWARRGKGGEGHGLGLAFARYKNTAAYAAVVVALSVDEMVKLEHIWVVADAGLVINPDGVRNQLEGGAVQGASWALKEQVRMAGAGVTSQDWDSYPILRFSEVPEIEAAVLNHPDQPSLGTGECAVSPTMAAIGNGVAHALGIRIRDMPLSRERIMASLLR